MSHSPLPSFALLFLLALPSALGSNPGFALRNNGSCPSSQSQCGTTAIDGTFFACCPSDLQCLIPSSGIAVCCPNGIKSPFAKYTSIGAPNQSLHCTRIFSQETYISADDSCDTPTSVCPDPSWVMYDARQGYFCCEQGHQGFDTGTFRRCANPGYKLQQGETSLAPVPGPTSIVAATSATATTPTSASPSSSNPSTSYATSSSDPYDDSSSSSSIGLSTGAKAGIGVGVALGVIALVGALAAWWILKKKRGRSGGRAKEPMREMTQDY